MVAIIVVIRDAAKLAAIRGIPAAGDAVARTKLTPVSVVLEHSAALAGPAQPRLDCMRVQRAVAIVGVTVSRGVPVDAALAIGDLVAEFVHPLTLDSVLMLKLGSWAGSRSGLPSGKPLSQSMLNSELTTNEEEEEEEEEDDEDEDEDDEDTED
eukprot:CAMPEP_0172078990 /NCGR_PEP_ID=MMETSP1043-20130122/17932_1 /TAXON_ID=464988 /ORGANISM="Hemiselmis andersenii, Strain CCMP441" /LENGTH=153 /DNA_ID=CAMNT_0012740139 /DNA_START=268 /DNA_END=727 /DNA_ORIENTATION=+